MHDHEERPGAWGISILGPTSIVRDGIRLDPHVLGGVKPRQVLEILALDAGNPVPKDRLAELVWDGHPPAGYAGTLQSYVCLVRRALGLVGRRNGIATVMHGYVLDPEVVTVDLTRFRSLVRQQPGDGSGQTGTAARLDRLEAAVALVSGDLLASEAYASWALRERSHFSQELAGVAAEAAACALQLGRAARAAELAALAIEHDPYAEEAWRCRIEALCAAGRSPEALRAYAELRDLLSEELGTSPSRATTSSYLAALQTSHGAEEPCGGGDELRLLLALVRRAMLAVPGVDVGAVDLGLGRLAASVSLAS